MKTILLLLMALWSFPVQAAPSQDLTSYQMLAQTVCACPDLSCTKQPMLAIAKLLLKANIGTREVEDFSALDAKVNQCQEDLVFRDGGILALADWYVWETCHCPDQQCHNELRWRWASKVKGLEIPEEGTHDREIYDGRIQEMGLCRQKSKRGTKKRSS